MEGGRKRQRTKGQVALARLANEAASGNLKAIEMYARLMSYGGEEPPAPPRVSAEERKTQDAAQLAKWRALLHPEEEEDDAG